MLPFRAAALVLVSIACFGASPQNTNSKVENKPPTVPVQLAKSNSMPMMPLVAPLFIANADVSSILTLVHDLPEPVSVDVSVMDKSGRLIAKFKQTIPPHGQTAIVMKTNCATCTSWNPFLAR